jgi:hypothetical protein
LGAKGDQYVNAVSLPLDARELHAARRQSSFWRRVTREPLLHFALIGAAIFAGAHYIEQSKQAVQASIVVDTGLQRRLANLYRAQFGVAPTAAQLRVIVDDYIDDEVLYREARRIGLDQDDEIIRRRLIQKLEFLQRDAVAASTPTTAELRAYYDAHPAQYSVGPRVSFAQVFFNPDKGGDARALARANEARAQWQARGEIAEGDAAPVESEYTTLTREDTTRLFGASDFATALFSQAAGDWSEPVRSGFGWHLVKVTTVEPSRLLPFEEVLPEVRAALLTEATASARRRQLDNLRARYHVDSRGAQS